MMSRSTTVRWCPEASSRSPTLRRATAALANGTRSTVLWRVVREGRHVLEQESHEDVRVVKDMAAQVRRDEHKMRAFVRFVPMQETSGVRYVAWYEPDHLIVHRAAPFFADRFASMAWSILTPDVSVHWDRCGLSFSDGVQAPMARGAGEVEQLWRVYYEAVFNPARLNTRAMLREMPARRWRTLPEAALIPHLVTTAHERADRLLETRTADTARSFVPETEDLDVLRGASPSCRGCRLHQAATQVVFGEGPRNAEIVLVGEQPGDAEDLAGRPFVGPGADSRPCPRRRRHRSPARVPDQRREALLVRAARQAAHPSNAAAQ